MKSMDLSIIVPLYNEAESLPKLYEWIERVMKQNGFSYEVIFVNDGSTDNSWQDLRSCRHQRCRSYSEAVLQRQRSCKRHLFPPQLRQVGGVVLRI